MKARTAMPITTSEYRALAHRVSHGDREASVILKRQLGPQMVYVVWHELRYGKGRTVIAKQIRAEARRVALTSFRTERDSPERFVSEVAEGMCDWVLDALAATPGPPQSLLDTVVAWS